MKLCKAIPTGQLLRGLRELRSQAGSETPQGFFRSLSLRICREGIIDILEGSRGLGLIAGLPVSLGQQESGLRMPPNARICGQNLNCLLRFLGTHQGLGEQLDCLGA